MVPQCDFLNLMESFGSIYLFRSLTGFLHYLKISGLSMQQAYALTYVFYNGPSPISALCEHMMVSAAATSQMVDRLEKQDLVKRMAEPGDRRVRNVVLTDKGNQFVEQSISARRAWVKDIPSGLSVEQQKQISAALKLLIMSMQDMLQSE